MLVASSRPSSRVYTFYTDIMTDLCPFFSFNLILRLEKYENEGRSMKRYAKSRIYKISQYVIFVQQHTKSYNCILYDFAQNCTMTLQHTKSYNCILYDFAQNCTMTLQHTFAYKCILNAKVQIPKSYKNIPLGVYSNQSL